VDMEWRDYRLLAPGVCAIGAVADYSTYQDVFACRTRGGRCHRRRWFSRRPVSGATGSKRWFWVGLNSVKINELEIVD